MSNPNFTVTPVEPSTGLQSCRSHSSVPVPLDAEQDEVACEETTNTPLCLLSPMKKKWLMDATAAPVSAPTSPGEGVGSFRRGSEMDSFFPVALKTVKKKNNRVIAIDFVSNGSVRGWMGDFFFFFAIVIPG